MNTKIIRTIWGMKGFENLKTYKESLQLLKNKGYSGIEVAITFTNHKEELVQYCKELDLDIIAQIHTCSYPQSHVSVDKHLESFQNEIEKALQWNPVQINCHGGRDAWNEKQNIEFFEKAAQISQSCPVNVVQETHRQRSLYNPYITKIILENVPQTKINLDISHWHVVSERALDSQFDPEWEEIEKLVVKHSNQIHARIGTAQSIQVNDPSGKEHEQDVQWYENIWKKVLQQQNSQGLKNFYITTEFGPYPYQPVAPGGQQPLGDLESANDWMKDRLQNNILKQIQ